MFLYGSVIGSLKRAGGHTAGGSGPKGWRGLVGVLVVQSSLVM